MIDYNDPNCVQRRIRPGSIDAHPTEKAIVVNYELEASLIGDLGDTMLEESKECQKIIRLKSLNDSTDIDILASEIIQKCSLIPPSKHKELCKLLLYLKTRKNPLENNNRPQTSFGEKIMMRSLQNQNEQNDLELKIDEQALISSLDDYIELLYEDLPDKVKSSWLILQLSKVQDNLIELTSNETLTCALARVLREDGKKSLDLSKNIINIFANFSNFSQFHASIMQFKVGAITFDIVETELLREESWFNELNDKKAIIEKEYNLPTQMDYEKTLKKYQLLIRKQNPLLRVAIHLLLNLSEDRKVEIKVVKKGIIPILVKILERDDQDLLISVVTFIKKLSIYLQNKNQMKELLIMDKLASLLSLNNETLIHTTLLLMNNLIFDLQLRISLLKLGLFPKLINLLTKDRHEKVVLSVLYQISRDDKCKMLFNYNPENIKLIMNKIINNSIASNCIIELMALGINLAINKKNAQLICESGYFSRLMKRAIDKEDFCIYKMLRNISHHDDPMKMLFLDYCDDLFENLVKQQNREEIVVEILAILSNLNLPQINWHFLFEKYNIFDWFLKKFQTEKPNQDDIVLQTVVLIGTAVSQIECANYLIEKDIVKILIDLLNSKQEDDEMVLQIVFVFYVLIKHNQLIEKMISDCHVPAYLIDLLHDKNSEIKKACNATLDLIAEHDFEWANKIKNEKFCVHNKHWLEMIQNQINDENQDSLSDYLFDEAFAYPNLMNVKTDLLNDSSSDNQSDLDLSIHGLALNASQGNNANHSPSVNPTSRPSTALRRPQTGYRNRR